MEIKPLKTFLEKVFNTFKNTRYQIKFNSEQTCLRRQGSTAIKFYLIIKIVIMNLFFKKLKSVKGVSLIELIVSVAIFSVLILSATGIFKMVIDGQRSSISAQNVQENMRYAMEKMSKEIRMAQVSNQDCGSGATNKVFNTANGGEVLYFKNQNGKCITYYLNAGRLKVTVSDGLISEADGFVTPAKIEVSNLKFYVNDDLIGDSPSVQPYVVMVMDVRAIGQAIHEQKMKIQMTISSRAYE